MSRRVRKRRFSDHVSEYSQMASLSNELLERIFSNIDAKTLIQSVCLTCKRWNSIVENAQWNVLPKFMYREVTICTGGPKGMMAMLQPDTHSDNRPKNDEERADPKRLRRMERPKKRREEVREIKLPVKMRYIACKRLILESMGGATLSQMLRDFSRLCLNAQEVRFNFCNFEYIKPVLVNRFFMPRKNRLSIISICSCRNVETCMSQEQFLDMIGELQGNFRIYYLMDHYSNAKWLDGLAELILKTRSFEVLELNGVNPDFSLLEDRFVRWLNPMSDQELKRGLDYDEQGIRKNVCIKMECNRGINTSMFYKSMKENMPCRRVYKDVPKEHAKYLDLTYSKILERSFDNQMRYSAHRRRLALTDHVNNRRFTVYSQGKAADVL